jgi:hypothetical protein
MRKRTARIEVVGPQILLLENQRSITSVDKEFCRPSLRAAIIDFRGAASGKPYVFPKVGGNELIANY